MLEEQKKLEKRLEELLRKGGGGVSGQELAVRNGPSFWYVTTDIEDRSQIALMVDGLRAQHPRSATVVIAPSTAYVGVGDALIDKLKAPEVISVISRYTGESGRGPTNL